MKKPKTTEIVWTALLLVTLLFGCSPEARRQVIQPPRDTQPEPPLKLEGLDQKIASMKQILRREDLSQEERLTGQSLLSTYERIEEELRYPSLSTNYREIILLLYGSLSQMDEELFKRPSHVDEKQNGKSMVFYSENRKKILGDYMAGNYQSAVNLCREMEKHFGATGLTSDIAVLYALSLGEIGDYTEAVSISAAISPELEKKPGFLWLRAKTVEWQLALGNQSEAVLAYDKLVDSFREREAVLKQVEQKIFPQSSGAAAKQKPPAELASVEPAGSPEPITTDEVLRKADELVRKGEYDKAKFLLFQQRLRLEEGAETDAIDRAIESLDSAGEKPPAEEQAAPQEDPSAGEALRVASALIAGEKYEEALAKLNELKQKQSLTPEAQNLEALATDKLINRERNKAAKLFLLARSSSDPVKKEELLRSSYDILKALADKYPTSPLNKKINDHMKAIQDELNKLKKQAS